MKTSKNCSFNAVVQGLLVLSFLGVVGCSSPEKAADDYYQKGNALLEKGELEKAKLEFRNALQINKKMVTALYGLAKVAEKQGEWQSLFDLLNKVLEMDPKNLEAQIKLGRLLLAAGQLDKALDASNKALALNKEDVSVLAFRAAVLLKLDDAKGAVENANLALAKDPQSVDALVVLATDRLNNGDAVKAIEYLDQGLKSNEKNIGLQLFKIQALTKLSKLDMAEDVFRRLISYYPESKELRTALAQFYLTNNRKEDAEKEIRAIVVQRPDDLEAKIELVRFLNVMKSPQIARQTLEEYAKKEPGNYPLQFALASFYQNQNDAKAAEAILRDVIEKEGDAKDGLAAKGMLAASLMAHGDKKAASQMIGEIVAKDQRNEQALTLKASMAIEDRKFDDAIADLRTILRDVPNSTRALLLLGRAHELAGSPELADENYLHAFQASKMAAAYGLPYAQFLLRRNQSQRAEKVLEDVLAKAPENMQVLRMLAQAKIARADWSGAQSIADHIRKLGDKDSVAEQIAGAVYAGQKNYSESISAFKRVYDAAPTKVEPVVSLVRAYLMAGKTKEASGFLDSVIQANPDNLGARMMQGQLYSMSGESQKAVDSFKSIIQLKPDSPAGYQQLAILHLRNKKSVEAELVIEQGLKAVPGDMGLRMAKAGLFELTGKNDDAIKVYEDILKDSPDSDVVINNLASLLSERKDKASIDRAFEISQRFKRSDIPQFKDTYGWASYKVGKFEDARSSLQSAAEQLPDTPIFHYHLGMTYLAKADKANAKKSLEKSLQLAGSQPFDKSEEIRNTLKGL